MVVEPKRITSLPQNGSFTQNVLKEVEYATL